MMNSIKSPFLFHHITSHDRARQGKTERAAPSPIYLTCRLPLRGRASVGIGGGGRGGSPYSIVSSIEGQLSHWTHSIVLEQLQVVVYIHAGG